MKLNIGCGFDKKPGYVNVDGFAECGPDILLDLETTPWPFETDSVDEIYAKHVLEHIGQPFPVFAAVLKECHRVLRHDGRFHIFVPHHLHPNFFADPTHVRAFTPLTFAMMSKRLNRAWAAAGENVTMLALMLDIDFEIVSHDHTLDSRWAEKVQSGRMTREDLLERAEYTPGILHELRVVLRCVKGA